MGIIKLQRMGQQLKYLILLFLCGCSTQSVNSIASPRIKIVSKTELTKTNEVFVPFVYTSVKLSWSYADSMPIDGVAFDIETRTNLSDGIWKLYCTTNQPPVIIPIIEPSLFIRVGAHYE